MSEIKRISPILDDYDIGSSISAHHGVTCFPAMRKHCDDRFIIKTVSIPATQDRLDALLLTGAFADATEALTYFKELSDQVLDELEILRRLAQLEGFLPYESWQVSAMSDGIGFDVYMISPYKLSLRKYCQKQPMTHLSAINLGLDICSALSVCRRSGYIYADLKPNNIYLTENNQFRIGDLGFLPLDTLHHLSLPERYISEYTAPEVQDVFAPVNSTIDVYALGLILFQIYNGGELPAEDSLVDGKLPAPVNADYEMAEIILKACDPDPAARWEDPVQMGQALVSYMQRNGANDTPIIPPVIPAYDLQTTELTSDDLDLGDIDLSDVPDIEEFDLDEIAGNEEYDASQITDDQSNNSGEEVTDIPSSPEGLDESSEHTEDENDESTLSFIPDPVMDETAPENNIDNVTYEEISDELNEMLSQADELAAHPVPDPVVAPEPVEISLPEETDIPAELTEEIEADVENEAVLVDEDATEDSDDGQDTPVVLIADQAAETDSDAPLAEETEEEDEANDMQQPEQGSRKNKAVIWILNAVLVLLILAIIAVGFFYYKNIYLLPIDSVTVTGDETSMVVHLQTDIDETLLSVVCSDSHGNQISGPVVNGTATFSNLAPDTAYNIHILVEGFHRLTGDTEASYSTPAQINVVQFSAVTGTEDGSVILRFTLDNEHAKNWSLSYVADGENEEIIQLDSNLIHLSGLTIGKEYTFKLIPGDDIYVTGTTEITHVASELVYAENVNIVSCLDKKLVVQWEAPEDVNVAEWTVRCYSDSGYNETLITGENTVTFENIDPAFSYNVDVTAAGMSDGKTAYMAANAITITDFSATTTSTAMVLEWETNLDMPAEGWILMYTVDNDQTQNSVVCTDNTAVITPIIPDATYYFTLQCGNGDAVLTQPLTHKTPKAQDFSGYGMIRSSMTYTLCLRPDTEDWEYEDLSSSDYTDTFTVGDEISVVGHLHDIYGTSDDNITALYVFRDSENKVVCSSYNTAPWNTMWSSYYGEFDIQNSPSAPGEYALSIYYNGKLVAVKDLIIEEA